MTTPTESATESTEPQTPEELSLVEEAVQSFQYTALFRLEDAIHDGAIESVDDCWAVLRDTTVDLAHFLERIPDEVKEETTQPFMEHVEFAAYMQLPLQQRFDFVIRHLGRAAAVDDLCQLLEYMEGAELTWTNLLPASPYSQHEPAQMIEHSGAWILCYRNLPQKPRDVDLHLLLIRSHRFYFQRVFEDSNGEDGLHPYLSAEEFTGAGEQHLCKFSAEMQQRIRTWLRIGAENAWIRSAYDPPFSPLSFEVCTDGEELADRILQGNWCLGQAFALDDICFINQVDGGDEWLTIKGSTAFESITMCGFNEPLDSARERLRETVRQIREASEIQCERLEYEHPYDLCPPNEYELLPESKEAMAAAGYELKAVIRNDSSIFTLAAYPQGDILLEYFSGSRKPTQSARVAAAAIPNELGADFLDLEPLEQFQRLVPLLRPTHEQS